jgi:hypothetical protein
MDQPGADEQGRPPPGRTAAGTSRDPITEQGLRCVLVVAEELPRWLAANTTAVLGVALGAHQLIPAGPDLPDGEGSTHPGIGTTPLPVLTAPGEELSALRHKAMELGVFVIDFNDAARDSKTYDEYEGTLAGRSVSYLGLALYGPKKQVNSVAGNLRNLR